MVETRTKDVGLAAFMDLHGCHLLRFESGVFVFSCEEGKDLTYWEVQYSNSCCSKHDDRVMRLRKFKQN